MARALGSYPSCPRFESRCRYHFTKDRTTRPFHIERPGGQAVKTPPFHGGNTGSSPVRVTTPFQPFLYGGIAQPVERPPHTRKVTDSSSVVSTILQQVRTFWFGLALFYASAGRASNSAAAGSPSPPYTTFSFCSFVLSPYSLLDTFVEIC